MTGRRPALTVVRILAWADAQQARTGQWPHWGSGAVADAPGETWLRIDRALRRGFRGLPGGYSLYRLLKERRGRLRNTKPLLSTDLILSWAVAHLRRTGRCPTTSSGPVTEAAGESWRAIDTALRVGNRGLSGDDSLSGLLSRHEAMIGQKLQHPHAG